MGPTRCSTWTDCWVVLRLDRGEFHDRHAKIRMPQWFAYYQDYFDFAQLGSAIDDFALDFLHLVTEKVILILSLYFWPPAPKRKKNIFSNNILHKGVISSIIIDRSNYILFHFFNCGFILYHLSKLINKLSSGY